MIDTADLRRRHGIVVLAGRWVVLAAEGHTPLRRLHAVEGGEASFLALDPWQVLDGYRCELSDADRAPIVINPKTMMGQQVLPHDCLYPLRHVSSRVNRVRRCSYSPVAATRRS